MTVQEYVFLYKYFQYKILKFEKKNLLFVTSVILILKGEVKSYTRWEWKTREWTTLLPSPFPSPR